MVAARRGREMTAMLQAGSPVPFPALPPPPDDWQCWEAPRAPEYAHARHRPPAPQRRNRGYALASWWHAPPPPHRARPNKQRGKGGGGGNKKNKELGAPPAIEPADDPERDADEAGC